MASPSYMPPLTILRDALLRRLRAIKCTSSVLTPVDHPRLDALMSAVKSTQPTASSLVAAASLVPNITCGFKPIEPLRSKNPLDYTSFQFGQGTIGWHFAYADLGSMACTLMFFRVEIAPPHILREMDIDPEVGVLYTISAGFGKRGGSWTTLPPTAVQGIYSHGKHEFNFQALPGTDCPWLQSFSVGQKDGVTTMELEWNPSSSPSAASEPVGYNIVLTPNKNPVYQGPKGCMPCVGGQGTLYWSYTSMTASGSIGSLTNPLQLSGTGWYDHQWMGIGGAYNSKITQLLSNIGNMMTTPKMIRWVWLTLQISNDLQYMLSVILDALPIIGKTYTATIANKFQGDDVKYELKAKVTIQDMASIGTQSYPTKYTIEIDGSTYTLQSAYGLSGVYLPAGILNWEGSGDVLDSNGTRIGPGFLEGNQLDTDDNLISTTGTRAGIPADKFQLFRMKKGPICTGVLSLIIILLAILFIIILLVGGGQALWTMNQNKGL